jgi:prepilin-type N-terminal cleavage/methylation domain-containing protein
MTDKSPLPLMRARHGGFTLIELLVVITIILLVSAVALPVVLPALSHRQVSEAARLLQGALVGARDVAVRDDAPSGIRLLPDPIFNGLNPATGLLDNRYPLAYNRIIPIGPAPEYYEGSVSVRFDQPNAALVVPYPGQGGGNYSVVGLAAGPGVLMIEETAYVPGTCPPQPQAPVSWFWNIRVGDRIQINNAGAWYTVVGPMTVTPASGNPEMFVNVGAPGTVSPLARTYNGPACTKDYNPEFLFLVNGQDDNGNGWVDEGWDGVDNNLDAEIANKTQPLFDELAEWETEKWLGGIGTQGVLNQPYTIQRRPAPVTNAREVALPTGVVIDATSWGLTNERTRVPGSALSAYSGFIDVLVNPDGSVVPTTVYSTPSSLGLDASFFHFWLAERSDVYALAQDNTGAATPLVAGFPFFLPMPLGSNVQPNPNAYNLLVAANAVLPVIKGESRIVTLFTRSGQITTNDNPVFNVLNVNQPFLEAQQGLSGGQQ